MTISVVELLLVGAVVAILGWVGVSVYQESQRPDFTLKRDDWACTESKAKSSLMPMLVGKVTIMMPTTREECVEYRRVN